MYLARFQIFLDAMEHRNVESTLPALADASTGICTYIRLSSFGPRV